MSLPNPDMNFTAFDILTAAEMNQLVENIEALADGSGLDDGAVTPNKLGTGAAADYIATGQSRNNSAFGDLATVGPQVTVDIGENGLAIVLIYSRLATSSGAQQMSFQLSGANTQAPSLEFAMVNSATGTQRQGTPFLLTGLNAGSTTFTAKYATTANLEFSDRRIAVIPL